MPASSLFLVLLSVLGASAVNSTECLLPWQYPDPHSNSCLCYNNPNTHSIVRCSEERVELLLGYCMTVDEAGVTYVGSCPNNYPVIDYENTTDAVYLVLPHNVSALNEYMCGPLNREGRVCGECQPGHSPSVHQAGFICSRCEWYGVPVYLLLELVPVTLFYLIILVFRISLTSAPMISFVIYCQLVTNVITYNASIAKAFILHLDSAQSVIFHIAASLGGIWNLDFLRFITFIPPVCVSEGLKNSHVILLSYVSAIYPQVLILITYTLIQLHNSKYGKCLVWACRPMRTRVMIGIRRNFDDKNTVLDVFTTFLVLSYSKLVLVALVSMAFTEIQTADGTASIKVMTFDTTMEFLSPEHFPIAAIGMLVALTFGVGPPLFLLLHPTGLIGKCLRKKDKLKRVLAIVNHIAERFQADYRDGMEGGPRLTFLAGMYMVIASASYFVFLLEQVSALLSWFGTAMWMIIVSLFILTVRPHKEHYMNVVSGLLMSLPALYCTLFVMYVYNIVLIPNTALGLPVWIMCLVFSAPQAIFIGYLIYKPIKRSQRCQRWRSNLSTWWASKKSSRNERERPLEDLQIPHRLEEPDMYRNSMLERTTSTDEQYPNTPDTVNTMYQV